MVKEPVVGLEDTKSQSSPLWCHPPTSGCDQKIARVLLRATSQEEIRLPRHGKRARGLAQSVSGPGSPVLVCGRLDSHRNLFFSGFFKQKTLPLIFRAQAECDSQRRDVDSFK